MLLKTIKEGILYKASEYVKKVSKHFIWLNDCKYTMLKIFKSTSNSLCIMLKCKLKYEGGDSAE